jgi:hypothetical protein
MGKARRAPESNIGFSVSRINAHARLSNDIGVVATGRAGTCRLWHLPKRCLDVAHVDCRALDVDEALVRLDLTRRPRVALERQGIDAFGLLLESQGGHRGLSSDMRLWAAR